MDGQETLGQRVRKLRQERGMTLKQVAGGEFSRAFLNQVEMGRSQPSTRVLRVIADRLGTPIDYLVEGSIRLVDQELALERARLALAGGDARRAMALADPLLAERTWIGSEARLCAAAALLALDRPDDANRLLDAEEPVLKERGDRDRLRRSRELRSGQRSAIDAAAHERLGERALREGRTDLALEHLRTARVLREAAPIPPPGA